MVFTVLLVGDGVVVGTEQGVKSVRDDKEKRFH